MNETLNTTFREMIHVQSVRNLYRQLSRPFVSTIRFEILRMSTAARTTQATNKKPRNYYHNKMLKTAAVAFAVVTTLLIMAPASARAQESEAKRVLAEREASLETLVKAATEYANSGCALLSGFVKSDKTCSQPSCGSQFQPSMGFGCRTDYGTDDTTCGSNCPGLVRSVNKSTVLFAPKSDFNNKDIQAFLASGEDMDRVMMRERDSLKAWQGVASYTGASRWFPGNPRGRGSSCSPYDPRTRSWYIAASSGPKDVILVLDVSGSMSQVDSGSKSRLVLMKEGAAALLDSFTFNDFYAIVTFQSSGGAQIITGSASNLIQATQSNIATSQAAVSRLIAGGGTHFESGFAKAFSLFRTSTEATSRCKKIILFLTDGIAEDGSTIGSYIANQQALLGSTSAARASIFTFSMGPGADKTRPREIACANEGIASHVDGGANPLDAMASYFKLLATAVNSTIPRWVEIYVDSFGMGRMTTVSRPVYQTTGRSPVFVGVVEIDVPIAELTKYVSETTISTSLITRGSECPVYNFTVCQKQILRAEAGYECPAETSAATCRSSSLVDEVVSCSTGVNGGVNSMLCESISSTTHLASSNKEYEDVACCSSCGLSAGAIVGIVIGATAGVIILGAIIFVVAGSSGGGAAAAGSSVSVGAAAAAASKPAPAAAAHGGGWGANPNVHGAGHGFGQVPVYPPSQAAAPAPSAGYGDNIPPPQGGYGYGQPAYGQPAPVYGFGA